jgi:phospholipid/cholesterol/gamma-HCH transport system substrate-binding protein
MDRKPADSGGLAPRSMGVKVGILLAVSVMVAIAFVGYVLYARGAFENFQRLTLVADNVEGVTVGMDLTYAGFPIGRVRRLSLGKDGKGRIHIRVPEGEAHWLRTTTVFVMEVPLVGATKIRAYSGNLNDPPLPDRSERAILRGDANEEIPRMIATIRQALENVENMTARDSSLQQSIDNVGAVTARMAGKYGVLGGVLGTEDNARKIIASIDRANALLANLGGVSQKLDGILARTDQRLYGAGGIADETQKAVAQANTMLSEVRDRLKAVDAILADAQAVGASAKTAAANVAGASADLGALRAEVEASLRKVTALIEEINRKWPFERDTKIKLP